MPDTETKEKVEDKSILDDFKTREDKPMPKPKEKTSMDSKDDTITVVDGEYKEREFVPKKEAEIPNPKIEKVVVQKAKEPEKPKEHLTLFHKITNDSPL
jgi:hypothetical protein